MLKGNKIGGRRGDRKAKRGGRLKPGAVLGGGGGEFSDTHFDPAS